MKIINKILLFLLLAVSSYSLSWNYDGYGVTPSQSDNFDLKLDILNNISIIYSDVSNLYKMSFLTYSNANWYIISSNFTSNQALQMQLFWDTNSFSYGTHTNIFLNGITNYSYNLLVSNMNFVTDTITNLVISNIQSYPKINYTGTNRSIKQSVVFVDRSKLYRASYMQLNGTTWGTNYRGFTSNPVSMFDTIFSPNNLTLTVTNISNVYTVYNTNYLTNITMTWTNAFYTVISTNNFSYQINYQYGVGLYSNQTIINGLIYDIWTNNLADEDTNIMYFTNQGISTSYSGTNLVTNWMTNFVNSLIHRFQYIDSPNYQWFYYYPTGYSILLTPGSYSFPSTTFYSTNVFTNNYISNLIVSTNYVTNVFTNSFTNAYSNVLVSDNPFLTMLYSDGGYNYKANVIQLSNGSWKYFGVTNGFSMSTINYPSLCQDTNNYWYAGYQDTGNNFKGRVMSYTNAGNWFSVGGAYNITNKADYTVLKSYNGNLFFAFDDLVNHSLSVYEYTNSGKWFPVGNANVSSGRALYVNMSIWTNGNITVAYADGSTNNRLSVLRYTNSGNWFSLGKAITSPIYNLKMILNTNGQPVIIFSDSANSGKLSVLEYR